MTSRIDSQLTCRHQWPSSAVCGLVLVCLIGQSILPGIANSSLSFMSGDSEAAGCCASGFLLATQPRCCCGPTTSKTCGCACGMENSSTPPGPPRDNQSSDTGRSIKSEICGCGGEHRLGMITSIDPAVLNPIDEPLRVRPGLQIPDAMLLRPGWTLPPPTPSPESCV